MIIKSGILPFLFSFLLLITVRKDLVAFLKRKSGHDLTHLPDASLVLASHGEILLLLGNYVWGKSTVNLLLPDFFAFSFVHPTLALLNSTPHSNA
jgi:hypothetical protein